MKRFISTWNRTSLIKRIAIGVVVGAVLGLLVPKFIDQYPTHNILTRIFQFPTHIDDRLKGIIRHPDLWRGSILPRS